MNRNRPTSDAATESSRKITPRRSAPAVGSASASQLNVASATPPPRRRSSAGVFAQEKPTPSASPSITPRAQDPLVAARRLSLGLPNDGEQVAAADPSHIFSLGDRCLVGNTKAPGSVRFIGVTQFAEGTWVGVELDEALGKNDGEVRGTRYFECRQHHGIFCRFSALVPMPTSGAAPQPGLRGSFSDGLSEMPVSAPTVVVTEPADAAKGTLSSTTTLTTTASEPESTQNLQRELAEAVEDHDVDRIQQAIQKAVGGHLAPKELENAQRVLNFELSRSLLQEIEDVRAVVTNLSDAVTAAGIRPSVQMPVDKELQILDNNQGPSMVTIAGMIERSREEIVTRLEIYQQQMAQDLEKAITKATAGIRESLGQDSADPSTSACREAPDVPKIPCETDDRGDRTLEAEALEDSDDDVAQQRIASAAELEVRRRIASQYSQYDDDLVTGSSTTTNIYDTYPVQLIAAKRESQALAREHLRQAQFRQREAAARVIQASWRMRVSESKPYSSPKRASHSDAEQQHGDEANRPISIGSEDKKERSLVPQQHQRHHSNRPNLTGNWQFSFEGTVHSWSVNGTMAYTPDGLDEDGEHLEIVQEGGREVLNGWCLIGRASDSNLLIWEDSESFERVVWIRKGHNLDSFLENMDEDIVINIMDDSTGDMLCELLAEKTWLVLDLMEAIQDAKGIHPRHQTLSYKGRPLTRDDEPIVNIIPSTPGEAAIVVCTLPHNAFPMPDDTLPRRPSMQDIKEAARCAQNTILAAVRLDPEALRNAPEDLSCDRELLLTAIREGAALGSLRPEFRADKQIVMEAVQKDGLALKDASLSLQADREIVLRAIMQNTSALKFAAHAFQEDAEILHAAGLQAPDLVSQEDAQILHAAGQTHSSSVVPSGTITQIEDVSGILGADSAEVDEESIARSSLANRIPSTEDPGVVESSTEMPGQNGPVRAWDPDDQQIHDQYNYEGQYSYQGSAEEQAAENAWAANGSWHDAPQPQEQALQESWDTYSGWQAESAWDPDAENAGAWTADEGLAATVLDVADNGTGETLSTHAGDVTSGTWDGGQEGAWHEDAETKQHESISQVTTSPSTSQFLAQSETEDTKLPRSRSLTPREIIQDMEYEESELMDAKLEVDARVSSFKAEVDKKEQELEEAEDAVRNASARLERYGDNPRIEEERDAAQVLVTKAAESLAKSRKDLARFSAASATLEAELEALNSEKPADEIVF